MCDIRPLKQFKLRLSTLGSVARSDVRWAKITSMYTWHQTAVVGKVRECLTGQRLVDYTGDLEPDTLTKW